MRFHPDVLRKLPRFPRMLRIRPGMLAMKLIIRLKPETTPFQSEAIAFENVA